MLKCKICGNEFYAMVEAHYISRDEEETGLSRVARSQEVMEYDTFDCPRCGCQFIAQSRKRRANMSNEKT